MKLFTLSVESADNLLALIRDADDEELIEMHVSPQGWHFVAGSRTLRILPWGDRDADRPCDSEWKLGA